MKLPVEISKLRIRTFVTGFAVMLFIGISLAWSLFVAPLEEYFGWTRANTSIIFTISILSLAFGGIAASLLVRKGFRFRFIFILSCLLSGSGFFLSTRVTHIAQLAVVYGVFCGFSAGMSYTSIISIIPLWFPEKSAIATGFLLTGYALSGSVIGPVVALLMNRFGWRAAFFFLGTASFFVLLAGAFFLFPPDSKQVQLLPHKKIISDARNQSADTPTGQMVKEPAFWVFMVMATFLSSCGMTVINHISPIFTESLDADILFATIMVSVISIVNGISRFCFGFILERIGPYKTIRLIGTLYLIALVTMFSALLLRNQWLFIPGACSAILGYGGYSTASPGYVRLIYGEKYFTQNFAIFNFFAALPPFIGPTLIGGIRTSTNSYIPGFALLVGYSVIGFTLSCILKTVKNKQMSK